LDIYLPDQSLVKSFSSPPASFSNEVVKCLFEAAHLHVTSSRRLCYAATPPDLSTRSLSGPALGMALSSAYAISGLSQNELCSSIYGTFFQEDLVQVLSLSECIPPDVFLNRWIWSDLSSEAMLLIPLEARISDVKRAEAQLARDQDRAVRHYTLLAGKMLLFALLPRFFTSLASPLVRVVTMNTFSMKGTGRSTTMPARALRQIPNASLSSPANCAHPTWLQQTTPTITLFARASTLFCVKPGRSPMPSCSQSLS